MPFELHTLEGRNLTIAYIAVALIQGGYLAWIAWEWRKTKRFAPKKSNEVSQS
jgi:threonine/homoserine/homoserine lactone efflux protein